MKLCRACGVEKPPVAYYKLARNKDGLRSYCIACTLEKNRKWLSENWEAVKAQQKEYRSRNIARRSEYSLRWQAENRERSNATKKAWRLRHPDHRSPSAEFAVERTKAWRQKNPERVKELARQRRARMKNPDGRVEDIDRAAIAERDGWRCHICDKKVTRETWSLDHLIPLSRGGEHVRANAESSTVACSARRRAGTEPSAAASPSRRRNVSGGKPLKPESFSA